MTLWMVLLGAVSAQRWFQSDSMTNYVTVPNLARALHCAVPFSDGIVVFGYHTWLFLIEQPLINDVEVGKSEALHWYSVILGFMRTILVSVHGQP